MMERRVGPVSRGEAFEIFVNGRAVPAYQGETIAGALLAAGITHHILREFNQACARTSS